MRNTHLAAILLVLFATTHGWAVAAANEAALKPLPTTAVSRTGRLPPFAQAALDRARADVAPFLTKLPDVPLPRDPGGGYTHERHKQNYKLMRAAASVHAVTKDRAYAAFVGEMLKKYAALYPQLPLHPVTRSSQRGRLFWQSLNDTVWLVETIQAYADVRAALSPNDRRLIETNVFLPMAEFLSVGAAETFTKIHNHGAWATAAVGMTGYVLGKQELIDRALKGLKDDGRAGFYKQIDGLYSPDGYYAEGPYYARYAIQPFIALARTIEAYEPSRKIFLYKDRVLLRAVYALVQQSYAGKFFPINDAIREKGLDSPEVINGVGLAYALTRDPGLLSIVEIQGRVALTPDGLLAAQALAAGRTKPFPFASALFRDGPAGERGGLAILRRRGKGLDQALVFEGTAQGMGHGHFDRLSLSFFDNGQEILADYGAARFLNVEGKDGGRYLPENETWAKQTVGHNTLVVDETSHFGASLDAGEATPTKILHFETGKDGGGFVAGQVDEVYPGVLLRRATAMIKLPKSERSVVVDLVRADTTGGHRYDLPVHYRGTMIDSTIAFTPNTSRLEPLGAQSGYQHLWNRAQGDVAGGGRIRWFNRGRYYAYTFTSPAIGRANLVELGANDPRDNLRPERAFILRGAADDGIAIASVLESYGDYSDAEEYARDTATIVTAVRLVTQNGHDVVVLDLAGGGETWVGVSWDSNNNTAHEINDAGKIYRWRGFTNGGEGE